MREEFQDKEKLILPTIKIYLTNLFSLLPYLSKFEFSKHCKLCQLPFRQIADAFKFFIFGLENIFFFSKCFFLSISTLLSVVIDGEVRRKMKIGIIIHVLPNP